MTHHLNKHFHSEKSDQASLRHIFLFSHHNPGDGIDDTDIYIGSCPYTSLERNNLCKGDINFDNNNLYDWYVFEVVCSSDCYGRYVYIRKVTSNGQLSLCEIEIYGVESKFKGITQISSTYKTKQINKAVFFYFVFCFFLRKDEQHMFRI